MGLLEGLGFSERQGRVYALVGGSSKRGKALVARVQGPSWRPRASNPMRFRVMSIYSIRAWQPSLANLQGAAGRLCSLAEPAVVSLSARRRPPTHSVYVVAGGRD